VRAYLEFTIETEAPGNRPRYTDLLASYEDQPDDDSVCGYRDINILKLPAASQFGEISEYVDLEALPFVQVGRGPSAAKAGGLFNKESTFESQFVDISTLIIIVVVSIVIFLLAIVLIVLVVVCRQRSHMKARRVFYINLYLLLTYCKHFCYRYDNNIVYRTSVCSRQIAIS
jgi:hypothetical protein